MTNSFDSVKSHIKPPYPYGSSKLMGREAKNNNPKPWTVTKEEERERDWWTLFSAQVIVKMAHKLANLSVEEKERNKEAKKNSGKIPNFNLKSCKSGSNVGFVLCCVCTILYYEHGKVQNIEGLW